ncbi:cytochrome c3 family protein [Pseudoalteromonas sp. C2R02]|uniref:cytochrome c3 family protein n=1 Tax=Pseudoalteromonas sp. C2R02 TaxID=2841565 RepID=UPI0020905541|nr:cytochrome c3 family protein [Pseudoalteromonas sp. C2R02]
MNSKIWFLLVLVSPYLLAEQGEVVKNYALELTKTDNKDTHFINKKSPNATCIDCHKSQTHDWQKSDHAKAMAIADKTNVLGDFKHVTATHYGQKALFYIENDKYKAKLSYDYKTETYDIKYTFGHFPLQQYLVETKQGSLQVLPFAWDTRSKEDKGQRWYHNYSNEEIRPEDRLHWQQPLQNWNGMCADCHSDGLVRNYDDKTNTFDTKWDDINVGCLSCHGDMTEHSNNISTLSKPSIKKQNTGLWLRKSGQKTAHWQGAKRDNAFMDNCFACHSLRSPLTDGFKANTPYLDQFTPQMLNAPMYHVDGQIQEEVYVYGSFLQSKMFENGVNCLDCHDQHTMKLKIEGNGLCLQCHGAEVYNVPTHHQHEQESTGAQCINCHMPTNRYMGVDDRRDHSFKISRPDLSLEFDTPNACVQCHEDKDNLWAAKTLKKWHVKPKALSSTRHNYYLLNSGQPISLEKHKAIINDKDIDVITRATAIRLLNMTTQTLSGKFLKRYLMHKEDLLRLSAATLGGLLNERERISLISPLLKDKYKAVRIEAARSLINTNMSANNMAIFRAVFEELLSVNKINSWRGEGRANQAVLEMSLGNWTSAEESFKAAIEVDPYFESGYLNLSELYRNLQRPEQEQKTLNNALFKLPKSAQVQYAFGLYLIRQQQHHKATKHFAKAMSYAPEQEQYLYTYVLSLDGENKTKFALQKLKMKLKKFKDSQQLKELGLYLSQKMGDEKSFNWFQKW